MLAVHIDTLLFILLVGMAALLRLLASKVGEGKKKPPEPEESSARNFTPRSDQPAERPPPETDADRIRKFLEALGQPTTSKPPRPVTPRIDIPPRPVAPVRPPPGMFPLPAGTVLTREQRRKRAVILHEGVPGTPAELSRQEILREEIGPPPLPQRIFTPTVAEAPAFQAREDRELAERPSTEKPPAAYVATTQSSIEGTTAAVNIISLLQSPSGLRNAVILREVFGPPRSLQPLAEPAYSGQLLQ